MFMQKTDLVVKVNSIGVKVTEDQKYLILEAKGSIMPNGSFVKVSKVFKETGETRHAFVQSQIDKFTEFADRVNAETDTNKTFYGRVRVAPRTDKNDKKKQVMYDKIKTDVAPDGKEYFAIDAWFEEMKSETIEGKEHVVFELRDNKIKKIPVEELAIPQIELTMLVTGYDDNLKRLELSSGGDYPVNLVVYQSVNGKGSPTIGQGYTMLVNIEKGKRIANEPTKIVEDLSWDNEEEIKKPRGGFEPDRLTIITVKKEAGYTVDGLLNQDPMDLMSLLG